MTAIQRTDNNLWSPALAFLALLMGHAIIFAYHDVTRSAEFALPSVSRQPLSSAAALNRDKASRMYLFHYFLIGDHAVYQCVAANHILLVGHSDHQGSIGEPRRDELSGIAGPLSRSCCTRCGRLQCCPQFDAASYCRNA